MAGKQAKVLSDHHVQALLAYSQHSRYPVRNRVMVLLSVKAGLRAGEIANLTWSMVLNPTGEIAPSIELHNAAAKMRSGRRVPLRNDLREALTPVARGKRRHATRCLFRTWRRADPIEHRQLVHHCVPGNRLGRVLVSLGPPNIRHPGCAAGAQSRWVASGCSNSRRAPVNSNNPTVHRRRHRCPTPVSGVDLTCRNFCLVSGPLRE